VPEVAAVRSVPDVLRELLESESGLDGAPWKRFVDEFGFLLLHVSRSLSTNRDETMDGFARILEELAKENFRRLRGYAAQPSSGFETWLVVVARRICVDVHRTRYGRIRGRDKGTEAARKARRQLEDLVAAEVNLDAIAAAPAEEPHARIAQRELHSILERALETLGPDDRLLLQLRFRDGFSAVEIARAMRIPSQFQVYRRINSVLAQLRSTLRAMGVEGSSG
jgi:RNA polymerase sigma factor (sigma-70 family)